MSFHVEMMYLHCIPRGGRGIGGGQHQFKWGINQVLHLIKPTDGEGGVEVGRKKDNGEGEVKEKGEVVGKWEGDNPSFFSSFTPPSPSPPLGCDREVSRGTGVGEGVGGKENGKKLEEMGSEREWERGHPFLMTYLATSLPWHCTQIGAGVGGGPGVQAWEVTTNPYEVWFSPSHFAPPPSDYLSFPSPSPSSPFSPFPIRPLPTYPSLCQCLPATTKEEG